MGTNLVHGEGAPPFGVPDEAAKLYIAADKTGDKGEKMIEIEGARIIGVTANLLKQTVKVTIETPVSEGTMDLADKLRLLAQAEILLVVTLSKLQPELPFEQTVPNDGNQMSIPGLVVINHGR